MSSETVAPKPAVSRLRRVFSDLVFALRSTVFVVWVIGTLAVFSLTATVWAAYKTWQVAQLTYRVAELGYQHRRAMARAMAKARIRRIAVAVPIVGAGAAVYFERQAFSEWQQLYPDGALEEYACDMTALTAEVLDEVLQGLPSAVRPPERYLSLDCNTP
jgi:hypothetical protein